MADGRWQLIATKVRRADSTFAAGERIRLVTNEIFRAKGVSPALVTDGAFRPTGAPDDLGTLLDDEQFTMLTNG